MKLSTCCKQPAVQSLYKNKYFCGGIQGCGKWCEVKDVEYDVIIKPTEIKNTFEVVKCTPKIGNLIETKEFSKDIKIIRCYAICMKDEHGQVIYTFDSKNKADDFYKELTNDK